MRARLVLVLAIALAGLPASASADCAGPVLTVTTEVTAPGEELRIEGEDFASECADVGVGVLGCEMTPAAAPEVGILLELRGDGRVVAGTVVDADDGYRFATAIDVPADLPPGAYVVVAVTQGWGETEPVPVTVAP